MSLAGRSWRKALEAVARARRGGFLASFPYLRSRPPEQWVDNEPPFDTVSIAHQHTQRSERLDRPGLSCSPGMKLNEILNPPLPALYQPPLDEQRSYPMYLRARHFRAIAIGCMFGGTFVGDHAGSQTGVDTTPFMKLSATTIGTYSGGVEQLCGRDAVAFSPTGRFLVFTDSELLPYSLVPRSRSFLTLDTRCVRDHGLADRCFFSGEGFDGARPVSWGERDATLFVVENRKTLVALDFGNDGTTARFAGRAELSRGAAITLTTSGTTKSRTADIEAIRLASAYFSANAQDAPRSLILKTDLWADGTVTAVSFDPDTLDASAFSARGRRSIPLSRAFLKRATLSRTQSGAAVLSDLGWTAAEAQKDGEKGGPAHSRNRWRAPGMIGSSAIFLQPGSHRPTGMTSLPSRPLSLGHARRIRAWNSWPPRRILPETMSRCSARHFGGIGSLAARVAVRSNIGAIARSLPPRALPLERSAPPIAPLRSCALIRRRPGALRSSSRAAHRTSPRTRSASPPPGAI